MKRLTRNPLLLGSAICIAVYWLVGAVLEQPYLSSAASLALLVSGGLTLFRYAPAAWRVVVLGERSEDAGGENSHLAVYGATLLAVGAAYTGLFGLIWVWFGQPVNWSGTAVSSFGRAAMAIGFWMLYLGPESPRVPFRTWLTVLLFSLTVIAVTVWLVAGIGLAAP